MNTLLSRRLLGLLLAASLLSVSSCQQNPSSPVNGPRSVLPLKSGGSITWNAHPEIAYHGDTTIGRTSYPAIYVMDSTGANWRCIGYSASYGGGNQPTWSGDGSAICWSGGNSGYFYIAKTGVSVVNGIPTGSGITAVVTTVPTDSIIINQASWCPTASTIAYTATDNHHQSPLVNNTRLFLVSSSGGTPSLIYSHDSETFRGVSWSPDGSKIAISSGGRHSGVSTYSIFILSSSGTLLDSIGFSSSVGNIDWSRTSGKIAYCASSNLYTIDTTAGSSPTLILSGGTNGVQSPSWSPTDWKIAYSTSVTNSGTSVVQVSSGSHSAIHTTGLLPGWKRN